MTLSKMGGIKQTFTLFELPKGHGGRDFLNRAGKDLGSRDCTRGLRLKQSRKEGGIFPLNCTFGKGALNSCSQLHAVFERSTVLI